MPAESFRMNSGLFPKAPPAKPLPEREWLIRTDRAEVGREAFFCGRDAEYEVFRNAAVSLRKGHVGGGTVVFQGAPGSGKTALMLECAEAVRLHSTPQEPWVAACVSPRILNSPESLMIAMADAAHRESQRLLAMAPQGKAPGLRKALELGKDLLAELSERGFGVSGFSVGGRPRETGEANPNLKADIAFRELAPLLGEFRVIILVDEAQNTPVDDIASDVLDCLHRDTQGIALVAAFFGLSDSKDVLRRCGLSRLSGDRVVNLEPLAPADAKASVRRMLDAYYAGTEAHKEAWAKALAELSQGWPQHVNRVGVAAGLVIRANEGQLAPHLLGQAMESGTKRKNDYYEERIEAGYPQAELYIALALAASRNASGVLSITELRSLTASELKTTRTSFDDFLRQTLHAGLLAPAKGLLTQYKFPIPSLRDYLVAAACSSAKSN